MPRTRRRKQVIWPRQHPASGKAGVIFLLLMVIAGLIAMRFVNPGLLRTTALVQDSGQCFYSRCVYLGLGSECTLPSIEVSCDYAACNSGPCTNSQIGSAPASSNPTPTTAATPLPLVTTVPATKTTPSLPVSGNIGEPSLPTPTPTEESLEEAIRREREEVTQERVEPTATAEPGPASLTVGGPEGEPILLFVWLQKLQDTIGHAVESLADFFRNWRGVANQRE